MRRTRPVRWSFPHGGTMLTMLLVATLLAPLPAVVWGADLPPVLGLSHGALAVVASALALAHVALQWRRLGRSGALDATITVALTAALTVAFARIIDVRANGFYTAAALFEGITILLGFHLAAGTLRLIGEWGLAPHARAVRHGLVRALRRRGDVMPVTATAFADFVTDGVATLVGAAWLLTALNAPNAAFTVMLTAGATEVFVVILRLPDAARALRRFRAPAAALAVIATLEACAARAPAFAPMAFAPNRAGPGCGIPRGDMATRRVSPIATFATAGLRAEPTGTLSLRLNVPAYRLDVLADSALVASYGVAIGMRKYRTPTGTFAVYRIIWNPWWIPPDSPWARKEKITPPGPANPMGPVKLLFGGPYYLHGTPFTNSIGSAASHGCIRMLNDDVVALAKRLQAHVDPANGTTAPDDSALAAIFADTLSRVVDLSRPVSLDIAYELAEVRGDSLLIHPDVYRTVAAAARERAMRERAMRALVTAGRDTTRLRRRVLATSLRRARTRHVAVPLDSVAPDILPGPFILVRAP